MSDFNHVWLCLSSDINDYPPKFLHLIRFGSAEQILQHPIIQQSFQHIADNTTFGKDKGISIDQDECLALAIYSLQTFLYANFIGSNKSVSHDAIRSNIDLTVDGEPANGNVIHSDLLILSKFLLDYLLQTVKPSAIIVVECWYIRYLYVHQRVLEALASSLYTEFLEYSEKIIEKIKTFDCVQAQAIVILEVVQGFLLYKRIGHANVHLKMVKELLQMNIVTEGVLGKRTKYQHKPLPQMLLRITTELNNLPASNESHGDTVLPPLLQLNDDLRLEKITFESEDDNKIFALPSIIQMLILAEIKYITLSQPKDKLADEELQPYLTTLLYQENGPWACRTTALLENIHFESNHKRTVDRSLKQCEEVIRLIDKGEELNERKRMSYAFASYLKPRWSVKAQFGRIMISLGLIKSALDLYLEIQKWNEIITCYNLLELRHKAAEVIEQELEKKPTVELLCLLGDAKDDPSYYEKAWELSGHRSGRAQRDWGFHYFSKRDYAASIPYLQKSVDINSLQENVWSRLGYAAIYLEQWELAAKAYQRYTYIEPNGFESWNNLAKAYINLNQKHKAHKVLQEALKCNFSNWKVWENFLLVSIDTGHFEDVINAFNQLIELKGKYYDNEVLTILVKSIVGNVQDAAGRSTERLLKKLQSLVSHLCVQNPHDGTLWELAAMLYDAEPLSKARKLQKAYQCNTQAQLSWAKESETCRKVLLICDNLCRASIEAYEKHQETEKQATLSQLSSARLTAQSATRAASVENWDDSKELEKSIECSLNIIKDLLLQSK